MIKIKFISYNFIVKDKTANNFLQKKKKNFFRVKEMELVNFQVSKMKVGKITLSHN
jgi:hypothetical protein